MDVTFFQDQYEYCTDSVAPVGEQSLRAHVDASLLKYSAEGWRLSSTLTLAPRWVILIYERKCRSKLST